MAQAIRTRWWLIGLAIVAGFIVLLVIADRSSDPLQVTKKMQTRVEQIRGLPFKSDVVVREQSPADFQKHAEAQLRQLADPKSEQVLRTVGLLAADETLDVDAFLARQAHSGAKAQYDPYSARLLLVKATSPQLSQERDIVFVRELYRALLDQHFDLKRYLDQRQADAELDQDELLARRMLVEGEALYASVLWTVKQKMGRIPDRLPLQQVLNDPLKSIDPVATLRDPRVRQSMGSQRRPTREPGETPVFLAQMFEGIQRHGMLFAHEVRSRGWNQFAQLYTSSPPVSTEQILHPEKYFRGERPAKIEWPAFESNAAFADWELLEQGVLGELMWRAVFRAHYLSPTFSSAPAGWNGDRYAVFKRRDSGDMLLLVYTSWDHESNARAFAETYRVLAKEKRLDAEQPVRIVEEGRRVVVVEGGEESSLDEFMKFALSAREIDQSVALER